MDQNELTYFVQVLQKRIGEYFQQSLVYEARFQQQNDIITQLNEKVEELIRSVEEYQSQIQNLDQERKTTTTKTTRKKTTNDRDGGEF